MKNIILTDVQFNVIQTMLKRGNLHRHSGGWTYDGVEEWEYTDMSGHTHRFPNWHCNLMTLRVLDRNGIVNLDEKNKICKLIADESKLKNIRRKRTCK
ncbi:hypothetical protein SDC9_46661 [bioreactor metagenome]|uniref:Uncharacterized protein n=1 Tax=bioreactor metagenome TaxID=1076179 RepID=A0A644WAA1_9ZZZZ